MQVAGPKTDATPDLRPELGAGFVGGLDFWAMRRGTAWRIIVSKCWWEILTGNTQEFGKTVKSCKMNGCCFGYGSL